MSFFKYNHFLRSRVVADSYRNNKCSASLKIKLLLECLTTKGFGHLTFEMQLSANNGHHGNKKSGLKHLMHFYFLSVRSCSLSV